MMTKEATVDRDGGGRLGFTYEKATLRVTKVAPNSPADIGGVPLGWTITHANGVRVTSAEQYVKTTTGATLIHLRLQLQPPGLENFCNDFVVVEEGLAQPMAFIAASADFSFIPTTLIQGETTLDAFSCAGKIFLCNKQGPYRVRAEQACRRGAIAVLLAMNEYGKPASSVKAEGPPIGIPVWTLARENWDALTLTCLNQKANLPFRALKWEPLHMFPRERTVHVDTKAHIAKEWTVCLQGHHIYVLDGYSGWEQLLVYDLEGNAPMQPVTLSGPVPIVRGGHTAVVDEGMVYIFGGAMMKRAGGFPSAGTSFGTDIAGQSYQSMGGHSLGSLGSMGFGSSSLSMGGGYSGGSMQFRPASPSMTPPELDAPTMATPQASYGVSDEDVLNVPLHSEFATGIAILRLDTAEWVGIKDAYHVHAPVCRHGHSAVKHNGNMYIFGGASDTLLAESLADLHVYNFSSGVWNELLANGNPPSPRNGHSATILAQDPRNPIMFVFGGWAMGTLYNDLYAYHISAGVWQAIHCVAPLPLARSKTFVVASGMHLYMLGGVGEKIAVLNDFYRLDFKEGRWIPFAKACGKQYFEVCDGRIISCFEMKGFLVAVTSRGSIIATYIAPTMG